MQKGVRLFGWLWCAHVFIAVGGMVLLPASALELKMGVTRDIQIGMSSFGTIVLTLLLLPFFYFAVWRRQEWAKWVLFAAFVLSILNFLLDATEWQAAFLPLTAVEFTSLIVEAAAFYFLFISDGPAWFRKDVITAQY